MKINFKKNKVFDYLKAFIISFLIGIFAGKLAVPVNPSYAINDISVNESSKTTSTIEKESAIEEAQIKEIASANTYVAPAISYTSTANNSSYAIKDFYAPNIINTNVAYTDCSTLPNPDNGPLQCGKLIYGHRTNDFAYIPYIKAGDIITVRGIKYRVKSSASYVKTDAKHLSINGEEANMRQIFNGKYADMTIMTCDNGTANRWLVFADLA